MQGASTFTAALVSSYFSLFLPLQSLSIFFAKVPVETPEFPTELNQKIYLLAVQYL
jgi:hypothetical protein